MDSKITIFFWILISAVCGKDVRIIGGQDAERSEFPYLASFRIAATNQHFCAGAIITTQHILTAAHCLIHDYVNRVTVHVGAVNATEIGSTYTIKQFIVHPDFTGVSAGNNGLHNDISVVIINGIIQMNTLQQLINLPTRRITIGENVTLCGWGLTSYPSEILPYKIQHTEVKIMDRYECTLYYEFYLAADQMCTYRENVGACIGDSGGPVVRNNEIVGIISFSKPCATMAPDIHTDVFIHKSFILDIFTSYNELYSHINAM
ncbi:PREDICTED: chymotrypsin-2-like [Ceratosolen solmsi marchali]|uniref:Chymotrypsin-2-like n=1 Tax=Ceratosolen solmsi marchali TaxID=326594 RepID=A0AAJ7E1U7_9HYME|nr:PREDICTED: chymotrypsin-2-like [Ceratosolen solmsi marchali]